MSLIPGKRKRITRKDLERSLPSSPPSSSSSHSDSEDVQALFRKAFEAKFNPLHIEPIHRETLPSQVDIEQNFDDATDWSGLSSGDEDEVKVFDYGDIGATSVHASKAEKRAFMSSRPPLSTSSQSQPKPLSLKTDTDPIEASHLKNDLALQSLLRESTLLSTQNPAFSASSHSTVQHPTSTTANTQGNPLRAKLSDLHIQSLGAKSSIFVQKSMPMAHRKGILAKKKQRDDKRRVEAKENGVILEREERKRSKGDGRGRTRDKGVGSPGVGKFSKGMLTLSKRDIASITRDSGGGRKGKGK